MRPRGDFLVIQPLSLRPTRAGNGLIQRNFSMFRDWIILVLNCAPESFLHISKFQDDFGTLFPIAIRNFNIFTDSVIFSVESCSRIVFVTRASFKTIMEHYFPSLYETQTIFRDLVSNRVPESFYYIGKFQDDFGTLFPVLIRNSNIFRDFVIIGVELRSKIVSSH